MFANKAHENAYHLSKAGKYDEALSEFEKALTSSLSNADIFSDRGVLYIHLNKRDEAMKDFNHAVELQPAYSFRYSARAYAFEFFGDTESAVRDYEKAIELDPKDAVAYNNLGLLQEKMGYQKTAKENFERADKLSKMETELYHLMDELESNNENNSTIPNWEDSKIERKAISPIDEREKTVGAFSEFKRLFTSKEQFSAFMKFIKNGFKIK